MRAYLLHRDGLGLIPYLFLRSSWWHDLWKTVTRSVSLGDGGSQVIFETVFATIAVALSDEISIGFGDVEVVIVLIPT